ncbi:hypothetical protein SanaruYs_35390 [Chryseotalea sanaruensis]|uniref:Uncharacterized protein n=1 Tax=Chryseotalea sanaruensis TaxID=2482724 RepID=A0A401UEG8_9BACT|nr:hypothetical protein [Chryseotalea sanaruensis]GCC53296.1 hypothetical protein SanaruYs_35390 [Chryseotalea sanaruensis]
MSIKSEREAFNWKAFLLMTGLGSLLAASVYGLSNHFSPEKSKDVIWYWNSLYWILLYPSLISSLMINNFRQSKLTITEFNNITDFNTKLLARIEKFKVTTQTLTESSLVFYPTSKFKKVFSYWFNAERMEMKIEEGKIVLIGPVYRISQVEDTLTWNKDFKK